MAKFDTSGVVTLIVLMLSTTNALVIGPTFGPTTSSTELAIFGSSPGPPSTPDSSTATEDPLATNTAASDSPSTVAVSATDASNGAATSRPPMSGGGEAEVPYYLTTAFALVPPTPKAPSTPTETPNEPRPENTAASSSPGTVAVSATDASNGAATSRPPMSGGGEAEVPDYLTAAFALVPPTQKAPSTPEETPSEPQSEKSTPDKDPPKPSSLSDSQNIASSISQPESPSESQAPTASVDVPPAESPEPAGTNKQSSSTPQQQADLHAQGNPPTSSQSQPQAEPQTHGISLIGSDGQPQADPQAQSGSQTGSQGQSLGESWIPGTTEEGSGGHGLAPVNPVLTLGSSTYNYNVDASHGLIIGSQTVPPGGMVSIMGVEVGLFPSVNSIIVAGGTYPVQTPRPTAQPQLTAGNDFAVIGARPPLTIGNQAVTANRASEYIIQGQTLVPGSSAITVDGTPISLGPSATDAVVGGSIVGLENVNEADSPLLNVNGQVITANSASEYIIRGQTLMPGASAVTIDGTPISFGPSATEIAVGGSIVGLENMNEADSPLLNVNGQVITATSASDYVVDGQTITADGASQFLGGGQTISPGAPGIIISGISISIPAIPWQTQLRQEVVTDGTNDYTYTVDGARHIVLASQTLIPGGPPVTVGGEEISDALDGSGLIIVSGGVTKTEPWDQATTAAIDTHSSSLAFTGSNVSTTTTESPVMTPLMNTAAATIPTVNPTGTSTKKSAAERRESTLCFALLLPLLVGCMVWH